jgi:hypothetical protein
MTTYAPHDIERDERVREAWTAYLDGIAELEGREYDEAEADSWDHLQDTLREIDGEHRASADEESEASA